MNAREVLVAAYVGGHHQRRLSTADAWFAITMAEP